jgi:hypothetical protein
VQSEPKLCGEQEVKICGTDGLTSNHEEHISRDGCQRDGDDLEEEEGFAEVQRD